MTEIKFEESIKKLEGIVDELEAGTLSLDEAIKKYEEGMRLSGLCQKKLQDIQKKVEALVKDSSGKLVSKDFDSAQESADGPASTDVKDKASTKKKRPKGEEMLF